VNATLNLELRFSVLCEKDARVTAIFLPHAVMLFYSTVVDPTM